MSTIKIAYIQETNPSDRRKSSGVPYKMYEQLRRFGYEIKWFPVRYSKLFYLYAKICAVYCKLSKKSINYTHTKLGAKLISKTVNQKLLNDYDVIYAPLGSSALYSISTKKPIIYESDATFQLMINYYFYGIDNYSIKQGNYVEKRAMDKSDVLVFASDWAAKSAVDFYKQDDKKVKVIEYGANLDIDDTFVKYYKQKEKLNILFLGVEWERKGGDVAVDTVRLLNEKGINAVLNIVGIKEKEFRKELGNLSYINYVGFLDKNNDEEYKKLIEIIEMCDVLLLPTRAECAGIAFCEASAYGLPIFSYRTGGIGNYVKDGVNGYLLDLNSGANEFAELISNSVKNNEIERMSKDAQNLYKERLNWNRWGEEMNSLIQSIVR